MAKIAFCNYSFDDVHHNLALEEILLNEVASGRLAPVVRIWRNPKSVILGISRSIETDLHIDNITEDKVTLARRISGGGTVYHDNGTISFSFIFPWSMIGFDDDPRRVDESTINPFLDIVIEALKPLRINSSREGISDIFVNGKKISGSAQKRVRKAILHHGTVLVDVDLDSMTRYLKVPPERENIKHEDFLTSLNELGADISHRDFQNLLKASLKKKGHKVFNINLQADFTGLLVEAKKLSNKYSPDDWVLRRK